MIVLVPLWSISAGVIERGAQAVIELAPMSSVAASTAETMPRLASIMAAAGTTHLR